MLQSIRDHTHGWIAGVIISLLILSFALWGIHSYFMGSEASNIVAKVNGFEISKNQYAAAYDRLQRQAEAQLHGEPLTETMQLGLRKQALDALIDIQVMQQASRKQDYRVSMAQIEGYIQTVPDFQVNGQFSPSRFQQVVSQSLMMSVPEFINLIQTSLMIEQPRLGMILTSFALPDEIINTYSIVNEERDISYALLQLNQSQKQTINITPDQIQAYYDQHQEDFRTVEQASIDYILLSEQDLMKKMNPSPQVLKAYYQDNAASYHQPFDQVVAQVKASYLHQQAEEKFAQAKEKLTNLTYVNSDTLAPAAKALGLTIQKTDLFTQNKGTGISNNAKVRAIAFSDDVLKQKNNSDVIQLDNNTVLVLRVDQYVPAAVLPLQSVQAKIETILKAEAMDKQLAQTASDIDDALQKGTPLSSITQQYHLNWNTVGYIGRYSNKVDGGVLSMAFAMAKPINADKPNYRVAKTTSGYAIVSLKGVKQGTLSTTNKDQYKLFAEQIQNSNGLLEYQLYKLSSLNKAKISVEL